MKPVTRSGAKPGDAIYVSGPLGGSMRGRHMTFEPRVFLGRQLAETGLVTAMIDLSDGLSRDLRQICRLSSVGAVIESSAVPVHDDAVEMRRDGRTPLDHALHDGEDYELLFTAPDAGFSGLARKVGMITASPGIWLQTDGDLQPLEPKGWEHSL